MSAQIKSPVLLATARAEEHRTKLSESKYGTAPILGEGAIDGERPILVTPGEYDFAFDYHETAYLFGRAPKLCCYFHIVTPGQFFEAQLCRYYNVKTLASKPRKGGAFKIGWKSDFLREYAILFGLPPRLDRVSTEAFKSKIIRGRVTSVSRDSKQRVIPESLRYSVISELVGMSQ
jgi:hypothetical protein